MRGKGPLLNWVSPVLGLQQRLYEFRYNNVNSIKKEAPPTVLRTPFENAIFLASIFSRRDVWRIFLLPVAILFSSKYNDYFYFTEFFSDTKTSHATFWPVNCCRTSAKTITKFVKSTGAIYEFRPITSWNLFTFQYFIQYFSKILQRFSGRITQHRFLAVFT